MSQKNLAAQVPSLQETAAKGVEAISQIVHERDELIAAKSRLETDFAMMKERATQLEGRLAQITAERDHYMRFATEIVTQLNTIRMVIDEAQRTAKQVAFKPPPVPSPGKTDLTDTGNIENLIRRLPQNGAKDAKN